MDTQRSAHTNRLHTVQSSVLCTTCVSCVGVICVSGVIFILCFSCAAVVLECSCATGCNFSNVCDPSQSCERRNMALGRPATISSLFNSSQWNQTSGPACLAVDGNNDTVFRPINQFPDSPNCVHTAENNNPSYWEVDLGRPYDIHSITVYARKYSDDQLVTAIIKVDNQTCFTISTREVFPAHLKADITCSSSQRGQRIQIYKETGLLMFCEVQVWVACGSNQHCAYCGHCKDNTDCDHTSRTCTQGCDAGWTGIECDRACTNGSYGLNCNKVCGNCSEGTTCDTVSGECPRRCKPGYQGSHCNVSCSPGTYGAGCNKTCGNCTGNSPCNIYDGRCETGCAAGYLLPSCKEVCTNGSYGLNCSKVCGNCSEGTTCDTVSGECPSGCKPGYHGSHCHISCSPGTYGADCNDTCGNCTGNSPCNIYDGRCETGCAAGYLLPSCKEACKAGTHGSNCLENCGNCKGNSSCNIYDGSCETGCVAGYQPPLCKECETGKIWKDCVSTHTSYTTTTNVQDSTEKASSQTCDTDHETVNTAGPIAGAVVGSVVCGITGFLLGVVFTRYRHRQRQDKNSSAACFPEPLQTVCNPHPTEVSGAEATLSSDYESTSVSTNVYDSLQASRDDNTASDYTSLAVNRKEDVKSSTYVNTK